MLIKILVENENVLNEHGLSLYIENGDEKILFDTAQSDLFIKNADILNVDLNDVTNIVLSHGHYDHGDGLKYLDINKNLICHPNAFTKRFRTNGTYLGLNQTRDEMIKKFNLIETKKPLSIDENIVFLGEIKGRQTTFTLENGDFDFIQDDSALAIKTEKGLVIITGCSHSGIGNIIEYSKKVMKTEKVYGVIGGFHLKTINEEVTNLIEVFKDVEEIYTGHCTSMEVIEYYRSEGLDVKKMKSLMTIEL